MCQLLSQRSEYIGCFILTTGFPERSCLRGGADAQRQLSGAADFQAPAQPTPVLLPGGSYRQRSLEATVHRVAKRRT